MTQTIILPGFAGSEPDHWQSRWEALDPAAFRFRPSSWHEPQLGDWIRALETAVACAGEPPVLVAHSLSCLLVPHWAKVSRLPVRAAFLVAVPDWRRPAFPQEARPFANPPEEPLRFPAMVVASTNDPLATLDYARQQADAWDARFENVGNLGHVNAESNIGAWPQGQTLLARLLHPSHSNAAQHRAQESPSRTHV